MPPKLIIGKLTNEQRIAMAIPYGDLATIEEFLKTTTNFKYRDFRGNTLLHIAVKHGHPLIVRRLVEAGAPVNTQDFDGNTPLHLIVGMDAIEPENQSKILQIVQTLLAFGADPMIKNNEELSPAEYLLSFTNANQTPDFNEQIQRIFEYYMQKQLAEQKKAEKTEILYPSQLKHKMEGGKKKMKSRRRKSSGRRTRRHA